MNNEQVALVLVAIKANWPHAQLPPETLDLYRSELQPLDYDETIATLRSKFPDDAFPPPPMKLRAAVTRGNNPEWSALVDELLTAIARVGYTSPEPAWSHPAIGQFVKQSGGWIEVCASTPARDNIECRDVFQTWHAQTRDIIRPLIAREDRQRERRELEGPDDGMAAIG